VGRANRRLPVDTASAIRLFAEHHIVAVRRKRGGEITEVKHIAYGWMKVREYYRLQKLHELIPLFVAVVEGGYRTKAALWGMSIEVAGFSIPAGLAFPFIEATALRDAIQAGNVGNALFWGYALLGPFGDALAVLGMVDYIQEQLSSVDWQNIFWSPFPWGNPKP